MTQANWENSFVDLNKDLFSADAVKGYDVFASIKHLISTESKILDFGCGKGNLVLDLRNKGYLKAFGVDPSDLLLSSSETSKKYPGSLIKLSGNKLPFESSSFDLVYCSGVLHHIEWKDYQNVFFELRRILKPGGFFVYLEPRKSFARTIGHLLVFSPIQYFVKQVKTLKQCLKAEWPTYVIWLNKEEEAIMMIQDSNFNLYKYQKKLLTAVAVFQAK